ncbi:hypothetical protein CORC01_14304 [Colletotrichum orchidophilum]|uniref:Uncharacterized protein n=1 Tax=Colletotrichum orchidophilum TaxID=1209926 RepID=A0A1G4AMX7_9PEZI|nr:uncharacterized protein CORC01_14304 [Colletotrichum orchidophilum]OHE90393.1 hypothetical protein CORC01_14304 [Colletotrichum orchidophilum]
MQNRAHADVRKQNTAQADMRTQDSAQADVRTRNRARANVHLQRVLRDITVPLAENLSTYGGSDLECLIESVNQGWTLSPFITVELFRLSNARNPHSSSRAIIDSSEFSVTSQGFDRPWSFSVIHSRSYIDPVLAAAKQDEEPGNSSERMPTPQTLRSRPRHQQRRRGGLSAGIRATLQTTLTSHDVNAKPLAARLGEPERPSLLSGSAAAPQSPPPSGSSHPGAIRSILFTDHEQFQALSPEIQPKVLAACAWLLLSEETQGRLNLKRRAKQAEVHARQAETSGLATAVRSMEDGDRKAIEFLQSVLLSDDDERD